MAISKSRSNSSNSTAATKSAQPTDNHNTDPTFEDAIENLSDSVAWFFSRPAALYKWLTAPKGGNRIVLGSLTIYFWAVSAEAYWQALEVGTHFAKTGKLTQHTETHPSFVPKPFSPNSGNLQNAGVAFSDPSFYVTSIISLAILGIQANLQRGKSSVTQAKRDYEAVKNFRVGEVPKDAIDVVKIEAKAYKTAGSHTAKNIAGVVRASYLVDIAGNGAAYWGVLFSGLGGFVASAVWIYIGVFGAEKFLALWQRNEDLAKADTASKRFPKVLAFMRKDRAEPKSESDTESKSA